LEVEVIAGTQANKILARHRIISDASSMLLRDKWVLITGASSGFGAAIANAFALAGAKLLLGARRDDRLKQVAAEARIAGAAEAHFHSLDVSKTTSVETFVAWAKERMDTAAQGERKLHFLINNAGGAHGLDTVLAGKDEDWETMLQTNVLGVLRMCRGVIPLMPHDAGAYIINIGSIAADLAYEGGAAYCAAKAGERKITETLRLELNGTGIRVSSIDPGLAETEFSIIRFKGDTERAKKVYEGTHPLRAVDIADTVVWVASRPAHVNIDHLVIKPVDQAAIFKLHRRKV
jgi:3-hydroxy acid dehydrogenase/malonic semialdehyde reductase